MNDFELSYGGTAADATASLKGSFVVGAYNGVGSPAYNSLHSRLRARYPTPAPSCGATPAVTDDDGHAIDLQDHDTDPTYEDMGERIRTHSSRTHTPYT